MQFKFSRTLLITSFLLGAAPVLADEITVVAPDSNVAVTTEGTVAVAPGSTILLQPGNSVVLNQGLGQPGNYGLVGIVRWDTTAKNMAWQTPSGMALYNYDANSDGQPNSCNGDCAKTWPPLTAAKNIRGIGEWTTVSRGDGTKQWAFRGHPLYTYVGDTMPGQVNGDNVNGFHLAD